MGVTRKMLSVSTLGLIDYRSDKERIARSTRKGHHQLRRQTRLMRQQVQAERATWAPVGQPEAIEREPRQSMTERLVERPESEAWVWTVFAVVFLVALVGHPGSLLFTLPVGVYLFWSRQRAARVRAQSEHDAVSARADLAEEPLTMPIPTVPDPVRTYDLRAGGRHSR